MPVATLSEAPVFERDGFTFRSLAVPSRGSAELAIWSLEGAAGAAGVEHSLDHEEVFVVQSGRLTGVVGGVEHSAGPGDALIVPVGTLFHLRVEGAEPLRATCCTSKDLVGTIPGQGSIRPPWAQ
jgi:mannose-6-phosphate isomerase-like protein (cupin superfamily)